ncbi:toll/interleukin-1 receptor domain-containing protein [Microbulbifer sp. JMSA004]|uniref:toll/interleukin-1 receptor domain-containing protein n=1 Tax=Microbulbifer sp. JMSA004 TaxID=3243370 RepID=UPI004039618C
MEFSIGILIFVPIIIMVLSALKIKNQAISKSKLQDDGFKYIFHGNGDAFIAFNIRGGLIRFGKLAAYTFVERPVSFIRNYEWKWVERDTQKSSNRFLFYISDVNYYMHEVYYYSESRQAEVEWAKLQAVLNECVSSQYIQVEQMPRDKEYDFFISHASEDKDDIVRPLVKALTSRGLHVWYDELSLEIGDSLRRKIDYGLSQSKFGIVVLSSGFFSKEWPQYELDALVNKSISGEKVILPIWHGVDHVKVSKYSHNLADKVAFSTSSLDISKMADEFLKLVQRNS